MVPIQNYENRYSIDSFGNVFSHLSNRFLKQENIRGYRRVSLIKNNKSKHFFVHRLVAYAFLENKYNNPFINHKNGIKDDNRVENLEWCTQKENIKHSWYFGLSKTSINQKQAARNNVKKAVQAIKVLNDEKVKLIFKKRSNGDSMRKIALDLNISAATVNNVLKGYKYVS